MQVGRLRVRDFRCYAAAEVEFGPGLTVIHGRNGAGKTNLLEALYFGCTARSCRTSNEREIIRFAAQVARVTVSGIDADGEHEIAVGFQPGEPKRITADGAPVERLLDVPYRPLAAVFLPDRLELIKGPPALRRAHLDQLVAALWPARGATRRGYAQALAQRNALLARIRAGRASASALPAWDLELATHGIALRDDRAAAAELLREPFVKHARALGLDGETSVDYRPRTRARSAAELAEELSARTPSDLERGFSGHGPHRDELRLSRDERELRAYGSQGEQRLALLALLLSERSVIAATRSGPPLMLLDDVMSELDSERRARLANELDGDGQAVITATEAAHVPGSERVAQVFVHAGNVSQEALAQ